VPDAYDPFSRCYEQTEPEVAEFFPQPEKYSEFEPAQIEKPKAIIEHLLDSSSRMMFGGGSKTYKTWAMTDMALSIACGVPWWGFPCLAFPILYINFELKRYYAQARLKAIRIAKKIPNPPENFFIWNLRGFEIAQNLFKDQVVDFIARYAIAVVFIDPFYRLLGDADERISKEIMPLLLLFEELNRLTDASIVCAAHFTKGNQCAKDPLDRISGGASINRHPDSLLTLTKHETEGAFTVDIITRDFPPMVPFVIKWQYPLLIADKALDPAKLKKPAIAKSDAFDQNDLLDLIADHDDEFSTGELETKAGESLGWSRRTFFRKLKALEKEKLIFTSKLSGKWNVKNAA